MASLSEKANKARIKAREAKLYYNDARNMAKKVAKTATGKELTFNEAKAAGKIVQNRRVLDTGKTAARGAAMVKRAAKKAAAERSTAAVTGAAPKKREIKPTAKTAKFNAATKAANAAKKTASKKK
jgi:hypothetical protein